MLPSHSRILVKTIGIASTSLQQRQSISLTLFLRYPHSRSSCLELFCKKSCLRPAILLKKRLWHRCFPVNFANFLWRPFFMEHLQWLLLAFAPTEISYSNTVCNISVVATSEAKDFIVTCIFLKIITFFIVFSVFLSPD